MQKQKVIIDTDPGVDDSTALILSFFSDLLDIKLISTVSGNVHVDIATRNACHLLDLFGKNIPVTKGSSHGIHTHAEDASYLHGAQGMGGYTPPAITQHQPEKGSAVTKMYKIIKDNPHEISILILGPHTDIAKLLIKYPDAKNLIKNIVFMGGSPYGMPGFPDHDSFNIICDPDAFQIVLDSGIPLIMLPSNIGRYAVGLNQKQVKKVSKYGNLGKFLVKTYEGYIEPNMLKEGYHIVATNDTCALYCLLYPEMFTFKKTKIKLNTQKHPGRTYAEFSEKGNVNMVTDIDKKQFYRTFFKSLKQISKICTKI